MFPSCGFDLVPLLFESLSFLSSVKFLWRKLAGLCWFSLGLRIKIDLPYEKPVVAHLLSDFSFVGLPVPFLPCCRPKVSYYAQVFLDTFCRRTGLDVCFRFLDPALTFGFRFGHMLTAR